MTLPGISVFDLSGRLDAIDDEGRPLLENGASYHLKKRLKVPMEGREITYNDGRKGYMMNVSALEAIVKHEEKVFRLISGIREFVLRNPSRDTLTIDELYAVAQYAAALPNFIYYSSENPGEVSIPAYIATAAKVMQGIIPTANKAAREYFALNVNLSKISGEDLSRIVKENSSMLIGSFRHPGRKLGKRYACAAPMAMIERYFDVICSGIDGQVSLLEEFSDIFPDEETLSTYRGFSEGLREARSVLGKYEDYFTKILEKGEPGNPGEKERKLIGEAMNNLISNLYQLQSRMNSVLGREDYRIDITAERIVEHYSTGK